jgi:hypothetical protein
MYGLPQTSILAQELFEKRLNQHGYCQSPLTPGHWQHDYRPISFKLCVDNFGIKYIGHEHAEYLASILSKHYCSQDWNGQWYLGMNIDWDYIGGAVYVSILEYIPEALTGLERKCPCIFQHQLYPHVKPTYGTKTQYTEDANISLLLNKEGKKYIQEVIDTFLYYTRCVDSTMLPARRSLATQKANST